MNHPLQWHAKTDESDEWFRKMKPEHQAGMAASVLVVALFAAFVLACAWGASCGITHSTASICQ